MSRYSLILLFLLSLSYSCTVQKEKEDQSFLGKVYHNMTSRYNGYFNADILLNESIMALSQERVEDFDTLLPVYAYMDNPNVENQYSTLDRVIEKVTTVSSLHPHSHWVDDNYLMLGKANFIKQDYKAASNAFLYLINNFDPITLEAEDLKKNQGKDERATREKTSRAGYKAQQKAVKERNKEIRKRKQEREKNNKKRGKKKKRDREEREEEVPESPDPIDPLKELNTPEPPAEHLIASTNYAPLPMNGDWDIPAETQHENYFLKHRPAYQEGLLWQGRSWTALENYFSAEHRLTQLIKDPKTFPTIRNEAIVALIDNYIKNGQFSHALTGIDHALERSIDRPTKIRLAFIAGQIHSMGNSKYDALPYFQKVRALKPTYEIDFYANLNIILIEGIDVAEKLEKLLRNENNRDYGGEIYYQLAKYYFQENQESEGIQALKKVSSPDIISNPKVKANAYWLLANHYYDVEDYFTSKQYYDSTLTVLHDRDPRLKKAEYYAKNLEVIANAIDIIALKDSLIRISHYNYDQKKALALSIKKKEQDQLKAAAAPSNDTYSNNLQMAGRLGGAGGSQSSFFAYNEKDLKKEEKAFQKIWGERALQDQWRLSAVVGGGSNFDSDENTADGRNFSFGITDTEIDEILADVPKDDKERAAANHIIHQALLDMAFSFRSDLNNLEKSNEILKDLLNRNPEREIQAEATYLLHLNALEAGNKSLADDYKNRFNQLFADTEIAKAVRVASAPVFNKETVAESAYKKIIQSYENENYEEAKNLTDQALTMFNSDKNYMPKFALMDALLTGKLSGKDPYVEKLKYLVANFPKSDEAQQARNYIQVLGGTIETNITANNNDFNSNVANIPHYILVTVPGPDVINDLKIQIGEFNKEYFSNDKLTISTVQITNNGQKEAALLIRRFVDQATAEGYYRTVKKQQNKFDQGIKTQIFPLAINNYRFLITEDRLLEYQQFINQQYNLKY